MKHLLLIAYGNPLRSDDGIAWRAAEELRYRLPSTTRIVCVHQLTPELAEDISLADLVVFLDASTHGQPGVPRCQAVCAESREINFQHHFSPQEILGFCDRLYSAKPSAFLISLPGEKFDHGQEFSQSAVRAVPFVVEEVFRLMKRMRRNVQRKAAQCSISKSRQPSAE